MERLIVWGGILALLLVVAFQARARIGYTMTLNALQERLNEDEGVDAKPLLLKDLGQYVVGWPSQKNEKKNEHEGIVELTWQGLTGPLGLTVAYDPSEDGGTVLGLQTKGYVEPEPEPEPAAIPGAGDEIAPLPSGAPVGPPPAGGGPPIPAPAIDETEAADPAADADAAPAESAPETP